MCRGWDATAKVRIEVLVFTVHPRLNERDKWVTLLGDFFMGSLYGGNQCEGPH